MILVDLHPGDPRLKSDLLPVLRELRTHLTPESLASVYEDGHGQGLRFTAAYVDGRCVGVAGWRVVGEIVETCGWKSEGLRGDLLVQLV